MHRPFALHRNFSLLLLFFVAITRLAQGQAEGRDVVLAESLFQQGRQLLEEGQLEQACNALEASLELERAVGTLLNLAKCYEMRGMVASAWSIFVAAEQEALAAGQHKRAALARKRHLLLAQRVPQVVFSFDGPLSGVGLSLDEKALSVDTLGLVLPLDPGTHVLVAQRDDGQKLEQVFSCVERENAQQPFQEIRLGPFPEIEPFVAPAPTPAAPLEVDGAADAGSQETHQPDPTPSKQPLRGPRRWVPPALVGVGAAGVLTGVMLGIVAVVQAGNAQCDANLECTPEGKQQRIDARKLLDAGYVVGISSGVVAATGLVSWVWLSKSQKPRSLAIRVGLPGAGPWGVQLKTGF